MEEQKPTTDQPASNNEIFEKLLDLEKLLKRKEYHSDQPTSKPLNFKEACAYLGYAPSYLYKLTYQKIIPHYKPTGKIIFFSKNELDEWIFKSSEERRVMSNELKEEKNIEKDPDQVDMFEKKKEKEDASTIHSLSSGQGSAQEIWIEFPLKSRRKIF